MKILVIKITFLKRSHIYKAQWLEKVEAHDKMLSNHDS